MKKSDLLEIIRTVVREEVNTALPQILMEVLAEKISNGGIPNKIHVTTDNLKTFASAAKRTVVEQKLGGAVPRPAKVYATNPVLNAVLNETVGGIPPEDTNLVASSIDVVKNLPKEVLSENAALNDVAKALSKDYSKFLKVVDSKAKANRPA